MKQETVDTLVDRADDPELSLQFTRRFDAPLDLVWAALTEARHLAEWSAPVGCAVIECSLEARVGGRWRLCMKWPDGSAHWQGGVVRAIEPCSLLAFTFAWEDEDGSPKHESTVTYRLRESDGQTELRFHQAFFESPAARNSHAEGWSETLDSLGSYLGRAAR